QVTIDLKALFKDAGVEFPPGSSITFNQKTSKIIIRNTPKNIEAFLKVLPSFDAVPTQVEIEARFIDISQSDLDELGFNWQFSGGRAVPGFGNQSGFLNYNGPNQNNLPTAGSMPNDTSGALRDSSKLSGNAIAAALVGANTSAGGNKVFNLGGVFNGATFNMIINALSQKQSTDVLNAPKVTTLSTVEATVKVVQSFIYPSEYSEPQPGKPPIIVNGVVTDPGTAATPSIPSGFKTKDVGVILRVTPTVSADKNTIDLMLTPEVTEFLGFIDYSPEARAADGRVAIPFPIKQPLFSERSVATRVVIWDGQTVVLGGLIKENVQKIDDKVPFLGDLPLIGRLFRSKVTNRSKQNLLIFVTARLIGPDGNPIRKEVTRGGLR
ncbi:MAG: type II and III secretion system protein, partial [Verrucomicrobiota bacterium]